MPPKLYKTPLYLLELLEMSNSTFIFEIIIGKQVRDVELLPLDYFENKFQDSGVCIVSVKKTNFFPW